MGPEPVREKSYQFALTIIELYKRLQEQPEYVISKQLLRSGTSIGANVEEAIAAESRRDFVHKMALASKEASRNRVLAATPVRFRISSQISMSPPNSVPRENSSAC